MSTIRSTAWRKRGSTNYRVHLVAAVAIATAIIVVIGVILGTGPWRSRETYPPATSPPPHTIAFAKPLNLGAIGIKV